MLNETSRAQLQVYKEVRARVAPLARTHTHARGVIYRHYKPKVNYSARARAAARINILSAYTRLYCISAKIPFGFLQLQPKHRRTRKPPPKEEIALYSPILARPNLHVVERINRQ